MSIGLDKQDDRKMAKVADENDREPDDAQSRLAAQKRQRVAGDILRAFHFACDVGERDIAQRLLGVAESVLVARGAILPRLSETEVNLLVIAYSRLRTIQ